MARKVGTPLRGKAKGPATANGQTSPQAEQPAAPAEREKRCFVISPIGADGSPTRKQMDDVFYCLIEPALTALGYNVGRGDHKARPGRITHQIIHDILNDHLIICVLTGANPNVYYEFAIAESAGRPIVVLKHKDEPIPFDVKDVRIIEYDLEPRRIYERTYIEQIQEAVRALEEEGLEKRVVPFAPDLSPLGAEASNFEVVPEYKDLSRQEVPRIAETAGRSFDLCGLTLIGWTFNEGLLSILEQRGERDAQVRVLIMHEDNPALAQMMTGNVEETAQVRKNIEESFQCWKRLASKYRSIEVRKVRRGIIYQQAAIGESEMIWTPYMMRYSTGRSPAVRVHKCGAVARPADMKGFQHLLAAVQREFDHLWHANRPDKSVADTRESRAAAK